MTNTLALTCNRISKRFGRVTALRSVSLNLNGGECIVLFGRNGAGKYTLLSIVASLIRSYTGDVELFGTNVRDAEDTSRGAIGFVAHESFLYADLSALDNLRFFAKLYNVPNPDAAARNALERFNLEAKTHASVRELSRGMKQRLSLARALIHEPKLLLLDEPFTGLDETSCEQLSALVREFVAGGGAVLLTTHDLERGHGVADSIAILERGALVYKEPVGDTGLEAFRRTYREVLAS